MSLPADRLIDILDKISDVIIENTGYLTELDRVIGDADHGLNMSRGFRAVKEKLPALVGRDAGAVLKTVGMTLVSTVGGASGPLYGTAFLYAGKALEGKEYIESGDIGIIAQAVLDGVIKRGKASPGDKTMVDTLYPVTEYISSLAEAKSAGPDMVSGIVEEARKGMESTGPLMALKGRASFLKERSIGPLDPGAVSSFLIIKAIGDCLAEGI